MEKRGDRRSMSTTSLKNSIDQLGSSEKLPLIKSDRESSSWSDTANNVVSFIASRVTSFAQCFVSVCEFLYELWTGRDGGIASVIPADPETIEALEIVEDLMSRPTNTVAVNDFVERNKEQALVLFTADQKYISDSDQIGELLPNAVAEAIRDQQRYIFIPVLKDEKVQIISIDLKSQEIEIPSSLSDFSSAISKVVFNNPETQWAVASKLLPSVAACYQALNQGAQISGEMVQNLEEDVSQVSSSDFYAQRANLIASGLKSLKRLSPILKSFDRAEKSIPKLQHDLAARFPGIPKEVSDHIAAVLVLNSDAFNEATDLVGMINEAVDMWLDTDEAGYRQELKGALKSLLETTGKKTTPFSVCVPYGRISDGIGTQLRTELSGLLN